MPTRPEPATLKAIVHARDGYRCRFCGVLTSYRAKNKPYSRTVDHLIPRSKGGRTNIVNLVTSCKRCNDTKKSFTLAEMGMRLRQRPHHSREQVESWVHSRFPYYCYHCDKPPARHGRPPYHGGPRRCPIGGTFFLPVSYYNYLRSVGRPVEVAVDTSVRQ